MLRLLRVELKKIFSKKSIYVIWSLMFLFCILNNVLFYTDYDYDGNYKYQEDDNLKAEKEKLEKEINLYSKDNPNEVNMYITLKTKLDIISLKEKYSYHSWQYNKINSYLYDVIYQVNYFTYVEDDNANRDVEKKKYEELVSKLEKNDYKYFLKIDINELENVISDLEEEYKENDDIERKKKIEQDLNINKFNLSILKYRLRENIKEDNSYLNKALEDYQESYKVLDGYRKLGNMTYLDKVDYQEKLGKVKVAQYILKNKININKQNTLAYQLRTIIDDYEIFFVILVLMVSSCIICDEFKDGTIKLLLIKPYSRCKILLSKYLTTIIVVFVSILMLIIMQFVVGGIVFKFESLNVPVVIYNFNTSKLIEYSIVEYMLIRIAVKVPFLLVLIGISMFLSILFNNLIISITMPLMLYMFSPTLMYLTEQYKLYFMRYLININWNLENYLFGKLPMLPFVNFRFSLMIVGLYLLFLFSAMFIIFRKKNIKNI